MKFAQLVIGPAGSGKSSYCQAMYEHCRSERRSVVMMNLDPAAEQFEYPVSIDVRELVSVGDVSQELKLGPNGGLVWCLQYLMDNISWLEDKLGDYDNDYLIIDCPGQIELYTHIPMMKKLTQLLTEQWQFNVCALYMLDSTFITDASKFISGMLTCLSAMVQLELPHINVLTKVDLLKQTTDIESMDNANKNKCDDDSDNGSDNGSDNDEERKANGQSNMSNLYFESDLDNQGMVSRMDLSQFCEPDTQNLIAQVCYHNDKLNGNGKFKQLSKAIGNLIDNYAMVSFLPLSIKDTDSIAMILAHVDHALQFGEDAEPKDPSRWDKEG